MQMTGKVVSISEIKSEDGLPRFAAVMTLVYTPSNNLDINRCRNTRVGDEIQFPEVDMLTDEECARAGISLDKKENEQ